MKTFLKYIVYALTIRNTSNNIQIVIVYLNNRQSLANDISTMYDKL